MGLTLTIFANRCSRAKHGKRIWVASAMVLVLFTEIAPPTYGAASRPSSDDGSGFTISDIRAGRVSDISTTPRTTSLATNSAAQFFTAARAKDGSVAIVDRSLLTQGMVAAANPKFVVLSWDPHSKSARYGISRDGTVIAELRPGVSNFRDDSVIGGKTYRYNVVPLLDPSAGAGQNAKMWSSNVRVPNAVTNSRVLPQSLEAQADSPALTAVAATTTVTYQTFIPQARIDAPLAGCSYGPSYYFGGDNHGYDWRTGSSRTVVNAVINWGARTVASYIGIGTTHVYRKSDHALVAQRTASGSASYARKMSVGGTGYMDVRLVTHASNPFCLLGAIDGAISMHMTTSGSYSVFGGNHRLMPSTYVFIYNAGRVTSVYKADAYGPSCLLGNVLCPLRNFYGSGSF